MSGEQRRELRIVLLGKTEAGKSSLGNTLLNCKPFKVFRGVLSGTDKCECCETTLGNTLIQVTDTPGVCDTHRDEEEVSREVAKSVATLKPGPHVILMVLRCDRRFTSEEYKAYVTLKGMFGDDIRKHMLIVFNGVDCMTREPAERQSALEEMLRESEEQVSNLREVISDSNRKYFAVDNCAPAEDLKQQGRDLLEKIEEIVQANGGEYYSSSVIMVITKDVETMIKQYVEENNTTPAEAASAVREAILKERVPTDIWSQWIRSVLQSWQLVSDRCSVM